MTFNTRIAPSPTGYFHLGTARTAYFNWLAARASGGRFILRIDDTDAQRNNAAFVDVIYQAMAYLGLDFDVTFKQSDRQSRYQAVAHDLMAKGAAQQRDGAVYLTRPLDADVQRVNDLALGQIIRNAADDSAIANLVLLKSDGMATYHFANVVDDIDYDINLILRGTDHIPNTLRQVAVYAAVGSPVPQYAHIGLLHDAKTGKKLSKSAGAPSLLDYQAQGIDADAMCNFLLRLGWGPKRDDKSTAMLPKARALDLFLEGGNLRSVAAKADFQMLASFDKKYKGQKRAGLNG